MTSVIPGQRSNQLSQQAIWELVIWSVLYKPVKGKDERMNIRISYINELRKYELDRKKIIAVIDTTFAVVERKHEKKNQACTGFEGSILAQVLISSLMYYQTDPYIIYFHSNVRHHYV